jgi:hypothetical protein
MIFLTAPAMGMKGQTFTTLYNTLPLYYSGKQAHRRCQTSYATPMSPTPTFSAGASCMFTEFEHLNPPGLYPVDLKLHQGRQNTQYHPNQITRDSRHESESNKNRHRDRVLTIWHISGHDFMRLAFIRQANIGLGGS